MAFVGSSGSRARGIRPADDDDIAAFTASELGYKSMLWLLFGFKAGRMGRCWFLRVTLGLVTKLNAPVGIKT